MRRPKPTGRRQIDVSGTRFGDWLVRRAIKKGTGFFTVAPGGRMPPTIDFDADRFRGGVPVAIVICVDSDDAHGTGFSMTEYVELADGQRAPFRIDRGWGTSSNVAGDQWHRTTVASIRQTALSLWGAYEEEDHGRGWMVGVLSRHGIETNDHALESLPVRVELSNEIQERCAS